jgi:hypothetical protein
MGLITIQLFRSRESVEMVLDQLDHNSEILSEN